MLNNEEGKIGWILLGLGIAGADSGDAGSPARLHLRDSTAVSCTAKIVE